MNGIRLFFKSAKGSVFSSLTLFVVLGAVLLTLNYTLSQYLYIRRAGEMFENAGLSGDAFPWMWVALLLLSCGMLLVVALRRSNVG